MDKYCCNLTGNSLLILRLTLALFSIELTSHWDLEGKTGQRI